MQKVSQKWQSLLQVLICRYLFIDDNSSWSGTADLTPFRIEVPIEVKDLTQKVEVKLHYNWYSPAGFVYVDPDIRLIDVIE